MTGKRESQLEQLGWVSEPGGFDRRRLVKVSRAGQYGRPTAGTSWIEVTEDQAQRISEIIREGFND